MKKIGDPVTFTAKIQGYYGLFRYDTKDVRRLAPPDANGFYFAEEPSILERGNPQHHLASVQFCRATVDTSRRLIRTKQLRNNFDLMLELLEVGGGTT